MNEQTPQTTPSGGQDSKGWVILGIALVVAGIFLGARNLGLVPWQLEELWRDVSRARLGIGVVLLGALLIVWASSGHRFQAPAHGRKLYRSRDDKWVAGVLGGLGKYFEMDVTLLRLVFLALVLLLNVGTLVAAYIIMAILVPVEPVAPVPVAQPPAWPTQPPPAVPLAPEVPAPPTPEAPSTDESTAGSA